MPLESASDLDLIATTSAGEGAADVFGLPEIRDKAGRQGGDVAGLGTGGSIDFHDHRLYLPGDDVRHINWQAYGRTGQYTMKLFREEVQPLLDVVLDLSSSMFYRPEKARRTAELVAFSCFAAAHAQAAARYWIVGDGPTPRPLPQEDILSGRWAEKAHLAAGAEADSEAGPAQWDGNLAAVPFRNGSVRLLLGDLLHDTPPELTLVPLANGAGLSLIWAPFCKDEADPPWRDNCELEDAEVAGVRLPVWCDSNLLRRYRESYARHFDLWTEEARRLGARTARIPCEGDLHEALLSVAGEETAVRLCR